MADAGISPLSRLSSRRLSRRADCLAPATRLALRLLMLGQKVHRAYIQCLSSIPKRQDCNVLLTALDQADICAIHSHAFGQCFLAKASF